MEKRSVPRIVESLDAEIVTGGANYPGIVVNFSERGLHLVTATTLSNVHIPPGTRLKLRCTLPTGDVVDMNCTVKWFQTKSCAQGASFCMGMEISKSPVKYREFVQTMV